MSKSTVSAIPFSLQIAQPCFISQTYLHLFVKFSQFWMICRQRPSIFTEEKNEFQSLMTESSYISWTTVSVVFKALKKSWKTLDLLVCVPARRGLIASLIRKYMNLTHSYVPAWCHQTNTEFNISNLEPEMKSLLEGGIYSTFESLILLFRLNMYRTELHH